MYHCPPQMLDGVPLRTVLRHLTCLGVEAKVAEFQRKKQKARR